MITIIQELIQNYNPKNFSRLVHCRPELQNFLNNWNLDKNCENVNEQFYCISKNIEPLKCSCGNKLLFNSFIKGYRNSCGNIECKSKIQAKKLSEFWKNNPEAKLEMIKKHKEFENSPEKIAVRENRLKVKQHRKLEKKLENERKQLENQLEYEKLIASNRIKTRRQLSSSYQKLINEVRPYTYLIRFKPTGQVYYGARFKNVDLNLTPIQDFMIHYTTSSEQVNSLIKEYGIISFEYEIRRTFDTLEQAFYWEQTVLRRCKVLHDNRWLNQNIGGYIVPTEKGRDKISVTHKGKPKSLEQRQKISDANKGKPKSYEARKNMSIAQQKIKRVGPANPLYGTHRTKEQKIAQRQKMKGRKSNISDEKRKEQSERMKINNPGKNKSLETRKRLSEAVSGEKHPNFGKHRSEETRKRISESNKGKPKSKEHCKNLSIAQKGKKRINSGPKGEKSHTAKLTEKQVLEIRNRYVKNKITYEQLAKEYNVSATIISYIINRKTWVHI